MTCRRFLCVFVCLAAFTAAPVLLDDAGGMSSTTATFGPNIRLTGFDQSYVNAVNQREPAIAANPRDPNNLVTGFFDRYPTTQDPICGVSYSTDGGRTWNPGGATPVIPGSFLTCGDPSLSADLDGNFYYAYISGHGNRRGWGATGVKYNVFVARSTDGGRSFATFSVAVAQDATGIGDKPYIGVDARPSSRFQGTIYLAYTRISQDPLTAQFSYRINVVTSTDRGETWSGPQTLSRITYPPDPPEYLFGALPVIAPDGTAYVFWTDYSMATQRMRISFSRSANGGKKWSNPADVASDLPSPNDFRLKNGEPQYGTDPNAGFLGQSFPTAAITPDGTIFVAWTDFPDGSCAPFDPSVYATACTNPDIRLALSRDGGKTWTSPVQVNDDAGAADQFFPWMDVHPDGLVSLVWMDKRLDPDNENFDAFYTNTRDGVHFLPNVRVSSETSVIGQVRFIGDYIGIAATAEAAVPVWTDLRTRNDQEVFAARGALLP